VYGVHDKQAAIELACCGDADALTCVCHLGSCFYSHYCVPLAVDSCKFIGLLIERNLSFRSLKYCEYPSYCCALVNELDSPMSRVTTSEEIPTIEEVTPLLYPQMASVSYDHIPEKITYMRFGQTPIRR
jgi:hypothetical protein